MPLFCCLYGILLTLFTYRCAVLEEIIGECVGITGDI